MQIVSTSQAPKAIGPYAQAIVIAGWIHTSGQIPLTASVEKVSGDIAAQTEQVLDNLEAVLAGGGSALAKVVSVTVYMTDLGEFAQMNEVSVFIGLLFWSWVWGFWGAILAVPMMMAIKAVCDHVEDLQPIGERLGD